MYGRALYWMMVVPPYPPYTQSHGAPTRIIPHSAGSFSGYSCDIWAAGVCLWAFVYGSLPFQLEDSPDELFEAICERELAFPDTKVHHPA